MTNEYFDLGAVRRAPLTAEPFRYALWHNPIPPQKALLLAQEFPTDGFERSERKEGSNKTYSFLVRKAVEKSRRLRSLDSLSPAWQAFIEFLLGPVYRDAVAEVVGERLIDHEIDIGFFVFTCGNAISVHTDKLNKAVTNVLYFGQNWQPTWGGQLSLYERRSNGTFEAFKQILPELGNGFLMVPSSEAWHGVSAVSPNALASRLTLQIEIWSRT